MESIELLAKAAQGTLRWSDLRRPIREISEHERRTLLALAFPSSSPSSSRDSVPTSPPESPALPPAPHPAALTSGCIGIAPLRPVVGQPATYRAFLSPPLLASIEPPSSATHRSISTVIFDENANSNCIVFELLYACGSGLSVSRDLISGFRDAAGSNAEERLVQICPGALATFAPLEPAITSGIRVIRAAGVRGGTLHGSRVLVETDATTTCIDAVYLVRETPVHLRIVQVASGLCSMVLRTVPVSSA